MIAAHPALLWMKEQLKIAATSTELEKNKLSPDIFFGYSNQSITGWQTTDGVNQRFYSGSNRFNSVHAGIAIPLFNKTTKNHIKAAKLNEEVAKLNTEQVYLQLNTELNQWAEQFYKAVAAIKYYESTGMQQASTISTAAQLSLEKGAIDYLQWGQLMNQATAIKLGYIDAVNNYNQAAIQLSYYISK
ncbi:MAG: TolC family protein, partial [Ferruginibacter sp.]